MAIKRDIRLDNIKVLLIFLVILGHVLVFMQSHQVSSVVNCIYAFHMPTFVFVNGYLLRKIRFKKIIRLMLLLIILQLLYLAWFYFVGYSQSFYISNLLIPEFHLWYLLAYIVWSIFIYVLDSIQRRSKVLFFSGIAFLILCAFCVRYLPAIIDSQVLSYTRILVFVPFFLAGYYWRNKFFVYFMNRCTAAILIVILMLSVVFLSQSRIIDTGILFGTSHMAELNMGWLQFTFLQIYQYLVAFFMIFLLFKLVTTKRTPLTGLTSDVTYLYLYHPFLAVLLVKMNFAKLGILMALSVALLATMIIIVFLLSIKKMFVHNP